MAYRTRRGASRRGSGGRSGYRRSSGSRGARTGSRRVSRSSRPGTLRIVIEQPATGGAQRPMLMGERVAQVKKAMF